VWTAFQSGRAGAMGGVLMNLGAGRLRDMTGNLIAVFGISASTYITVPLIIHLLVPQTVANLQPKLEGSICDKRSNLTHSSDCLRLPDH
jgi:hypothetical protein